VSAVSRSEFLVEAREGGEAKRGGRTAEVRDWKRRERGQEGEDDSLRF